MDIQNFSTQFIVRTLTASDVPQMHERSYRKVMAEVAKCGKYFGEFGMWEKKYE